MTKLKKVLTIVLAFVMVITLSPIQANAAKKVKLNKSKLSLYVGKSYTLKLKNNKNKVKWSSSKKAVATVSSKGKIKAKKRGNCKITAKVGKKKYVCKVTVKKKVSSSTNNEPSNSSNNSSDTNNSSDANNNSSSEDNTFKYIGDRSVEYNSANSEFRIFFSLKNSAGTRLNSSGNISMTIFNNDNVEVYNKIMKFSKEDFGEWTSLLYGTRYLCCIKIPKADILPSTTTNGKLYFDVSLDNGTYFDASAYSISDLPKLTDKDDSGDVQNECELELPELPETLSYIYNRTGHIYSKCTVNNIEYEFSRKLSGKYDLKITFDATKVYDENGDNGNTTIHFLTKLYLEDSIIDSSVCFKMQIVNNQSCSISKTFSDLEPGNYRLELVDYIH